MASLRLLQTSPNTVTNCKCVAFVGVRAIAGVSLLASLLLLASAYVGSQPPRG